MSAWGFMLSRLKGAAVNAEDRPMSLEAMAVCSNGLLMSTLLHFSEKDMDASDTAQLRSLTISTRLRVDNNEQHLSCYGPDSSMSFSHPSVMPPRENIVSVEEVGSLVCHLYNLLDYPLRQIFKADCLDRLLAFIIDFNEASFP